MFEMIGTDHLIHPVREVRDEPLSAGFFYGSLIEAAAVALLALIPPFAAVLAVTGVAFGGWSVYRHLRTVR